MDRIALSALGAAAALTGLSAPDAAAKSPDGSRLERAFFGGGSAVSHDLSRVAFWSDVVARQEHNAVAARAWIDDAVLREINQTINAAPYVADTQGDHWQTSAELAARGGDCEDYATAKYFALRDAGIPAEALRVAIVADEATRQRHAVLLVQVDHEVLLLDNLTDAVLPASAVAHYRPLLALNEDSWMLANADLRRAPISAAPAPCSAMAAQAGASKAEPALSRVAQRRP